MKPKPYTAPPWQLPHLLATPVGGTVLIVERCDWKPREPGLNLRFSGLELGYYFTDMPESGYVLRSRDGNGAWNDRTYPIQCPLGPVGTLLACKERFLPCKGTGGEHPIKPSDASYVCFRDGSQKFRSGKYYQQAPVEYEFKWPTGAVWRFARSMPLWACRLFLRTTAVDLRRVDTMTEGEALAWGCPQQIWTYPWNEQLKCSIPTPCSVHPLLQARINFENDNSGAKWGDWAWFITAERIERC